MLNKTVSHYRIIEKLGEGRVAMIMLSRIGIHGWRICGTIRISYRR